MILKEISTWFSILKRYVKISFKENFQGFEIQGSWKYILEFLGPWTKVGGENFLYL